MNQYEQLIARLDAFIRRFYTNKLIRGVLLFLAAALAYYLLVSLGEYYFYFPSWVRFSLLGIFISVGGFALVWLIIIPLLQTQKLGKVISHEKAAQIIGNHFPDVQDKLLNVLQLRSKVGDSRESQLLLASIEQKTKELSPIPFQSAVNYSKNKKYLKYILPPVLAGLFILLASPDVLIQSSKRLLSPSKTFIPPAPFEITLKTKNLRVAQFEDIEVIAGTQGKSAPDQMYMLYNGQEDGLSQRLSFFEKDPVQWKDYAKTAFFQNLCTLKHSNKAVWAGKHGGKLEKIPTDKDNEVYAFTREKEGDRVVIVVNLTKRSQAVTLRTNDKILGAYLSVFGASTVQVTKEMQLNLKPWEYLVLTNK